MDYGDNSSLEHPERDVTLLAVNKPIILNCCCSTGEERLDADEVDSVLAYVGLTLRLIPLKLHSGHCNYEV